MKNADFWGKNIGLLKNSNFLDSMSSQLRNLRSLGENLGREVDDQNKMLDRIDTKARRNDDIVRAQDKQVGDFFVLKHLKKVYILKIGEIFN